MSTTKKQKSTSKNAKQIRRKPVAKASHLARSKKFSKTSHRGARIAIISVISALIVLVIIAVIVAVMNTPERATTRKVEEIARDYYENYYYPQLEKSSKNSGKPLEEALAHYAEVGFSKVNLSQLFLFDNGRHRSDRSSITSYCDETNTYITIFPEAPYGRKNYHIDYHYSCNF